MDDKNINGNKIGQDDRMDRMRCPGLDRGRTNYGRPAVRAVSAHRGGALAADLRCLGDLLLNPESSISKSLIRRIGLTQVVDFHDFSGYFSCFSRRSCAAAPVLDVPEFSYASR